MQSGLFQIRKKLKFKTNCLKIAYRPFDEKWTYFDNKLIWRPRTKIMQNLLNNDNVCVISARGTKIPFQIIFYVK